MEMVSQTSQCLLADLLREIWESEASEEEMRVAAESCGCRYLTEFFAFVKDSRPEGVSWEQKWRPFVARIDAKSI